ncbi:pilus assembly protein [Acidithiobacillus sp.]|uniref:Flp family type IVb pilin n=1 Tax=Acidithiobacillus sp. TaxID=1872118 RepID=UPI0025C07D55|nr:pilus assembly protein [Acidithiobacillus sp.]
MFIGFMKSTRNQRGQGMTEYLIVVALIAISAIAVFSNFGRTMRNQVGGIAHELVGTDSTKYGVKFAKKDAGYANDAASKQKTMGDYSSTNILSKQK